MGIHHRDSTELEVVGPIFSMHLGWHSAQRQAAVVGSVPDDLNVTAMVDTGAESSIVDRGLADQLGLQPSGVQRVVVPGDHAVIRPTYAVRLTMPGSSGTDFVDVTIIEVELDIGGVQVLVGRDVLSRCLFLYDGRAGRFTLAL